jgi:hypothetical protein
MKKIIFSLLVLFLFPLEGSGFSYKYFWCGSERIAVGDALSSVAITCGNPDHKEKDVLQESTTNVTSITNKKNGPQAYTESTEIKKMVQVHYFYDCGDFNFVYKLTFEDSKLMSISSISKGTANSTRTCNAQ